MTSGLESQEGGRLSQGARSLGIDLDDEVCGRIGAYLDLLSRWSRRWRLVGTSDRHELIERHILDCLAPAPLLAPGADLVDVGAGPGLPGLVLAIASPDVSVTLVESRRIPCSFMRDAIRSLGLRNACVVEDRIARVAAEASSDDARRFDYSIARAWRGLGEFLDVSRSLLRAGGSAIAMRGAQATRELAAMGDIDLAWHEPERLRYQLEGSRSRTLLVFRKRDP